MCQTLFTDTKGGKIILVPKSSGPLLERLPLNSVHVAPSKNQRNKSDLIKRGAGWHSICL